MTGTAIFRADASVQMGLGHLMRCLALAQAWHRAGGRAAFISHALLPALQSRLLSDGLEVYPVTSIPGSDEDALETLEIARATAAEWLFVDGYHFGTRYLNDLRSTSFFLGVVDDFANRPHEAADLVVNPNILPAEMDFPTGGSGELLMGLKYALVRQEFRERRPVSAQVDKAARHILVTLGGSDPENVTLHLLRSLSLVSMDDLDLTVVSGVASPHHQKLRAAVQASRHPARLLVDVRDMPELLLASDIVISGAGGTCAEAAVLGVSMMLVIIAENQAATAEEYAAQKLAVNLGWCARQSTELISAKIAAFLGDPALRRDLARNAFRRVDGKGAERVVDGMKRLSLQRPAKQHGVVAPVLPS